MSDPIYFEIVNQSRPTPLINGVTNAHSQFDKYGEIKYPGELSINIGYGFIEGYLGKFSGNGWKGIALEAAIGAESNVAAALTAEKYYNFDSDHKTDGKSLFITGTAGAVFGGGLKASEEGKLTPFIDFIKKSYK